MSCPCKYNKLTQTLTTVFGRMRANTVVLFLHKSEPS